MAHVNVIDLFAGAGGLGIGAQRAGGVLRLSVDTSSWACETLRLNGSAGTVMEADVTELSGESLLEASGVERGDPLIVVGGAPCQPFSKAAYWVDDGKDAAYRRARATGAQLDKPPPPTFVRLDSRRSLVEEFWRLVEESGAQAFVFENVRSIMHPRHRPVLDALIEAARRSGFSVETFKATAADYGVPQLRQRVFVIGSRISQPSIPAPTHAPAKKATPLGLAPYTTAGPTLQPFADDAYFEPEELIEGRWAEHLADVPPGWNYKWHTEWAGHASPTFVTETRYWNFLLKLSPERPSWTINASPGPWTGPFHWETRRLRTPELAALQTFPPKYQFAGPYRERVRQIGNAVPCLLAATAVRSAIESVGAPTQTAVPKVASAA